MVKDKLKIFIKKVPWLKEQLIKFRSQIKRLKDQVLPKYLYKSRITSFLYYTFFSWSFFRELQAVLGGKAKYIEDARKSKQNYFLLVRNTHRLEKGLLMRPRRKVFAKGYIEETIDSYISVRKNMDDIGNKQLKWFDDVLSKYFKIIGKNADIDRQEKRFLEAKKKFGINPNSEEERIPYLRNKFEKSQITFDEFYKLSRQRRSVRWFQEKEVPRKLIDKALETALQAPSACNRQPFEFRIFDEPRLVDKVINLPGGTRGYAHNVPVVAVVVGNLDAYFDERDRHVIYIDASLASMSFMYALEILGLSSCPINWPDVEKREKRMEKLLGLEVYQRPIMLLAIGYPDENGKVAYSEKRPLHLIRQYN